MWAFKQLWDKGLLYEGYRVLPYCWECETPLSNFETRQDDAYRDRQDPAVTVAFDPRPGRPARRLMRWPARCRLLGVDDDAVDAAVQPGPRRRPRRRRTRSSSADGVRCRARRGDRWPATRRSWRARPGSATVQGRDLVGRRYRPLFPYFAGDPERLRGPGRRLRDDRGGHRRRPHGPGLRRGRPDRSAPPPASRWSARSTTRAGSPPRCPTSPGSRSSRPTSRSSGPCASRASLVRSDSYVHAYPHCWRTDTPLIYRAVSSWFVDVTAIKDRMLERNQEITLGARARPRRLVRQMAGERPRLVDHPQPLLGLADPGVEERRPRLPPHRRLRQPRRARAGLRGAARPTCTARPSTS